LSAGVSPRADGRVKPLEDIRIVAVEQFGAGPFGTLQLADLGAEVIKLEDPAADGDVGRYVPPYAHGEDSLFFETFNRTKRSVSIDLSTPGGREVFEDLVRVCDAVYANVRGDVPERSASSPRRCGSATSVRATGARRAATRTPTKCSGRCSATTARIEQLSAAGALGRYLTAVSARGAGTRSRSPAVRTPRSR
jgi:hypothetical protein